MSTRCNIIFIESLKNDKIWNAKKGFNVKTLENKSDVNIYKHSNGEPSNIIPLIKDFMSLNGSRNRIEDLEYLGAWFISYLIDKNKSEISIQNDFLGYGISKYIHSDIEYLYIFNLTTRSLYIYSVLGFDNNQKFKEIYSIGIYDLIYSNDVETNNYINVINENENLIYNGV